jgi:hypothetical protein
MSNAPHPTEHIYLREGEKKARTLRRLPCCATLAREGARSSPARRLVLNWLGSPTGLAYGPRGDSATRAQVDFTLDTQATHSGQFSIMKEDHTLGNMITTCDARLA